jgi:hypothetical protein
MSESAASATRTTLNFRAAVLGWILPGLGHASLGDRRRGLLVGGGVLGLFLGGLLIGGLDVVDRREDHLWFLAQAGAGPVAWVADYANANLVASGRFGELLEAPHPGPMAPRGTVVEVSSLKSLAHPNEMGTLFAAMAGLMNVVAVLDAMSRRPAEAAS